VDFFLKLDFAVFFFDRLQLELFDLLFAQKDYYLLKKNKKKMLGF
jgi:hypothetical protein